MKRFFAAAILVLLLLPARLQASRAPHAVMMTAGSAPQAREGLRKGILVLGIPAAGVFAGILVLAWKIKPRGEIGPQASLEVFPGPPPPTK